VWLDGTPVLDESLHWRSFQREVRAAVIVPVRRGARGLRVEIGARPRHRAYVDESCPSRNRERVLAEVARQHPDALELTARVVPADPAAQAPPALSLRFLPSQFRENGVQWQQVLVRPVRGLSAAPPSTEWHGPADEPPPALFLRSSVAPFDAVERTGDDERRVGVRRFYVPVAAPGDEPAPLRAEGEAETRVEPVIEIARTLRLTIGGATGAGAVTIPFPGYESLGRHAPRRTFRPDGWPASDDDALRTSLPEPVLPPSLATYLPLYDETWRMLLRLARTPRPESGLPSEYISTGSGFVHYQFVWDTSFTAICTAYGARALPIYGSMDLLYSRQFDGGYVHREHDVRDGMPVLWEPDFSPNPPILSVAEWAMAGVTGDTLRLRSVYPALAAYHRWIAANRKLPDGTYWTTGLANGLDNSPSLGDGYPDLTAQMAHDAETLGKIARLLGDEAAADAWEAERDAIGAALNRHLWSEEMQIYATSLAGGGHNPHKVVTAFWPLWAGVVPPERVDALADHLTDPSSFWRHHPIPSLAADSPHFAPHGDYWLGSAWSPTNYAAIKGFQRAGRLDLARETTRRHLDAMADVLADTGRIWENYGSEASVRGSTSMADYCWSALGPIALLFEVLLGFTCDALHRTLHWSVPPSDPDGPIGIRRLPLGAAIVSVVQNSDGGIHVETDRPFTLVLTRDGAAEPETHHCPAGRSRIPNTGRRTG
jgi:hypothetical protein